VNCFCVQDIVAVGWEEYGEVVVVVGADQGSREAEKVRRASGDQRIGPMIEGKRQRMKRLRSRGRWYGFVVCVVVFGI